MGNAVQAVNLWPSMRDLYGFRKQSFLVGKSTVEILPGWAFRKLKVWISIRPNWRMHLGRSCGPLWFTTSLDVIPTKTLCFFVGIIHGSNQTGEVSRSLKTPLKCTKGALFSKGRPLKLQLCSAICSILQKDTIKKNWNSLGNSFFYANFDEFGTSVAFSGHHRIDSKSSVFPWYFPVDFGFVGGLVLQSFFLEEPLQLVFQKAHIFVTSHRTNFRKLRDFWTCLNNNCRCLNIFEDFLNFLKMFLWFLGNLSIFDCCYSWINCCCFRRHLWGNSPRDSHVRRWRKRPKVSGSWWKAPGMRGDSTDLDVGQNGRPLMGPQM